MIRRSFFRSILGLDGDGEIFRLVKISVGSRGAFHLEDGEIAVHQADNTEEVKLV